MMEIYWYSNKTGTINGKIKPRGRPRQKWDGHSQAGPRKMCVGIRVPRQCIDRRHQIVEAAKALNGIV